MGNDANYRNVQNPPSPYRGASESSDPGYSEYQNPRSLYPPATSATAPNVGGLGNGVNLQPSYNNAGDVDLGWSLMRQCKKIASVRIEIEPGRETHAQRWILEAIQNGYSLIATYHKVAALASDDDGELLGAAAWWASTYDSLRSAGPFVVNLMNEWGSPGITPHDFAASYNKAIANVRGVYNGPIIIDLPGWGQEARVASEAIHGSNNETIKDQNVILSTHIYPDAWSVQEKRGMTVGDLDLLAATGRACIVGEFGDNEKKDRHTDWAKLVSYAKSKAWPVFGWAWNGDGGNMNMTKPQFQPFVSGKSQTYTKTRYFDTINDLL